MIFRTCLLLLVGTSSLQGQIAPGQNRDQLSLPEQRRSQVLLNDTDPSAARPVFQTDKWIGIVSQPVDDVLRSHLNIAQGQGLVVLEVVPGSPSEKCGLKPHDILLTMDAQPITDINALVAKTAQAGPEGYAMTWLRSGSELSGVIVPETRPSGMGVFRGPVPGGPRPDVGALRAWIDNLEQGNIPDDGQPMRFRFFGPAVPGAPGLAPEDGSQLSISIQRDNDQPAKIVVRKNGQMWEVTEDNLNGLPDDVRIEVERTLRGGQRLPTDFLRRFDQMENNFERMFDKLEELRNQRDDSDDDSIDA